jgi:hypothetical protein
MGLLPVLGMLSLSAICLGVTAYVMYRIAGGITEALRNQPPETAEQRANRGYQQYLWEHRGDARKAYIKDRMGQSDWRLNAQEREWHYGREYDKQHSWWW